MKELLLSESESELVEIDNFASSSSTLISQTKYCSFYCCYLLISQKPKCSHLCYVGSTNNPVKRLRQHNGDIVNGAKKTSKHRPWKMVLLVYGFTNKYAALQFEWAWQKPHLSRHLRRSKKFPRPFQRCQRSVSSKLLALFHLLHVPPFCFWSLQIQFNDSQMAERFYNMVGNSKAIRALESTMELENEIEEQRHPLGQGMNGRESAMVAKYIKVECGPIEELDAPNNEGKCARSHKASLQLSNIKKKTYPVTCIYCGEKLDIKDLSTWVCCSKETCSTMAHLVCMANDFLKQRASSHHPSPPSLLIPVLGQCRTCLTHLRWGELIHEQAQRREIVELSQH